MTYVTKAIKILKKDESLIFIFSLTIGCLFAYYSYSNDLITLYIDDSIHLNIARRVTDSLTPGIDQLGNTWLPFLHISMLPFIWNDFLWCTGLAGTIPSLICFALVSIFCTTVWQKMKDEKGDIKISAVRDDFLFLPEEYSAKKIFSRKKSKLFLAFALISFLFIAWTLLGITLIILFISVCLIWYFSALLFRLFLFYGGNVPKILSFSEQEIESIDEKKLPNYVILIALYKEAEVLNQLFNAIKNIDYPKNKLKVKLLLEEDDKETIEAIKKEGMPDYFEIIVLRPSYPRTKPKALNVGLTKSNGDFLVLYDAEDIPERDQLKKAYLAFKELPEDVVCVQSKLNYYNRNQNLLTRLFTAEYCLWFDFYLPGLQKFGCFIPLGGTSNHFKLEFLKEVGGWDPYNVTEDCDLGVRLFRKGYKTAIIDSTTWEEANSKINNWIRQRSRWIKGFIQTFFVHTRNPVKLVKDFGWKNFFAFLLIVPSTPALNVLNVFFWFLTIYWFSTKSPIIRELFPWYNAYLGLTLLIFGNFIYVYMHLFASINREFHDVAVYSLLTPFYWILMSFATLKSVWQMFFKPHFWEKTIHGLHLKWRRGEYE